MRILVTGHRGYLGTLLVPALLDAGHAVQGMDAGFFEGSALPGRMAEVPESRKDVRDVERVDIEGCDAVVHLAGLSNDPLGDFDEHLTEAINHHATARLAEMARDAGARTFVFSSTCSVYGAAGDEMLDERSPRRPVTPYASSKARAEDFLLSFDRGEMTPVILRHATAYGVSPRMRFDLAVNNLVAWACSTGRIHLKSDGSAWRPLVHVRDMVASFVAAVEAPPAGAPSEIVNVGRTDQNFRIRELAERIATLLPGCEIRMSRTASTDRRCYRVSCDHLNEVWPELRPEWTIDRGIAEVAELCRRVHATPDEFEGPRYCRVEHIKRLCTDGRLDRDLRWVSP